MKPWLSVDSVKKIVIGARLASNAAASALTRSCKRNSCRALDATPLTVQST